MQDALDKETEEQNEIYQEKINIRILRAQQLFKNRTRKEELKIHKMMEKAF